MLIFEAGIAFLLFSYAIENNNNVLKLLNFKAKHITYYKADSLFFIFVMQNQNN